MRAVIRFAFVFAVFMGLLAMHGISPAVAAPHCDEHHETNGVSVDHEHAHVSIQPVIKEPCPSHHAMHSCVGMVRKSGEDPVPAFAGVLADVPQAAAETHCAVSARSDSDTQALRKPNLHLLSISRT